MTETLLDIQKQTAPSRMPHAKIDAATPKQLGALLELGRRFHRESGLEKFISFDAESFFITLEKLASDDNGILLAATVGLSVVGMTGAIVYPHYVNHKHKTCQEMFWYVLPAYRQHRFGHKLYERLELEMRIRGVQTNAMIALEAMNPKAMGRHYARMGYSPTEHVFMRRL